MLITQKDTDKLWTLHVLSLSYLRLILLSASILINIVMINAGEIDRSGIRGKPVDTIYCTTNKNFSYSLYLPSYYSDSLKWPVIYSFDPGSKGIRAIKNFKEAAEKYGFIVAGSNNSANGNSWDYNLEAAKKMISDLESKFNINSSRKYTAGFSGGSRVASMVAIQLKGISGVIGCGAGFPGYEFNAIFPSFDYIGIIGNRDMNYLEMYQLELRLKNAGTTMELRIFDGGHGWPQSEEMQDAIEWIQLRALKKGLMEADSSFINYYFKKNSDKIDTLLAKSNFLLAAKYYNYLKNDCPDYFSKDLRMSFDSIFNSREYKKAVKTQEKIIATELDAQNELANAFKELIISELFPDSIRYWWNCKGSYFKRMEKGKDINKQMMASRLINLITSYCYETGRNYISGKKYEQAVYIYLIATFFMPDMDYYYIQLAKARALYGDKKGAVIALETAVKNGLKEKKFIADTTFNLLTNEKRFIRLLEQLK